MNYNSSYFDSLNRCSLEVLRALAGALGIPWNYQTAKWRLISDIITQL